MEKNKLRKTLGICIIFLFIISALIPMSIGYKIRVEDFKKQISLSFFNSNIFGVNENRKGSYTSIQDIIKDVNSSDFNFGFILCTVIYIDFYSRCRKITRNVNFELSDYDTGDVIEEKTCFFGIYLFKFLSLGNNYVINVTAAKGSDTVVVRNMGIFRIIPINFVIFEY